MSLVLKTESLKLKQNMAPGTAYYPIFDDIQSVYCILYLLFHYLVMSSVSQRDFQYDGREFWCVFRALNVVLKGVSWSALPDT